MQEFSVLMSVYHNDCSHYLKEALLSVYTWQTVKPSEIILVIDGPVSDEIYEVINTLRQDIPVLKTVPLKNNRGLGNALRIGTEATSNEIIARMDSDDIALPDRFEKEIGFLEENPEVAMVGGQISEFIGSPENVVGNRIVPCSNEDIYSWMRKRCPFNHMTVAFRKSKILEVGNYVDWHYNEDYYLWIRMAEAGYKFANLPDTLVNVRVGKEMYARRGGWKYFKSEKGIQDYMLRKRFIGLGTYLFNVLVRFGVQVVMPNSVRGFIFKKLFRKNK
ncbi:MAG: glycosyltransferase [Muribaculaceae bacterium]|nr:glycosyltransferase [Muribaculaceae bacterium]